MLQAHIIENFLADKIDDHVDDILSTPFIDVVDGDRTFKGIQQRGNDLAAQTLLQHIPACEIVWNFVRQSYEGIEDPSEIHEDSIMGDVLCLLYLNKKFPKGAGTSLYVKEEEEFKRVMKLDMSYGNLVMFPSNIYHNRNIYNNFGQGRDSRLVQVLFLKSKHG